LSKKKEGTQLLASLFELGSATISVDCSIKFAIPCANDAFTTSNVSLAISAIMDNTKLPKSWKYSNTTLLEMPNFSLADCTRLLFSSVTPSREYTLKVLRFLNKTLKGSLFAGPRVLVFPEEPQM
jgi:hypothetical protein